jgi:hypothetical protein
MVLFVFEFELFILRLYHGSTLQTIALSVILKLFNGLDYFVSSLQPVCVYKSLLEVLWYLPPQLVVEVILFHQCQEQVFEALQVSIEVNYQPSF